MWITNIDEMSTGFYFMRLRKPDYPTHIVKIVSYEDEEGLFVKQHGQRGEVPLKEYFSNIGFKKLLPEGFEFKKIELPE